MSELVKSGTLREIVAELEPGDEFISSVDGAIVTPEDIAAEPDSSSTWQLWRSSENYGRMWRWRIVSARPGAQPMTVWRSVVLYPRATP